jgi:uncharacterized protein involved in exopolysaccharide biosynthesis
MTIEEDARSPQEYLEMLRRRRWRLVLPFIAVVIISAIVSVAIPPIYQSTGTVLIEEPDVPREFVESTITSFAAQRLQIIQQRVMTTQNLVDIINKFNLYADRRQSEPIGTVVEDFRELIALELVSADVVDPRSGRASRATIAFNLSFSDRQPRVAQQVANELVSLYLNANLRDRREKAAETTGFLADEAKRFGQVVGDMEARLAEFKRNNAGQLPEQLQVNLRQLERTENELHNLEQRTQALEERKIIIQAELSQLSPYGSRMVDGQTILSSEERLKALQTKYISVQGTYGEDHPDVVKLRREIEVLKRQTGADTDVEALRRQLREVQDHLSVARKQYGNAHPDVTKLKRQADSLKSAIAKGGKSSGKKPRAAKPDNPNYIMMEGQLKTVVSEIKSLQKREGALRNSLKQYEERVLRTPEAERQYLGLKRDYENARHKYREIKAKQLQAQLAQSLETERKSERFSLIEPPQLPREPVKPNRLAILFIGIILAGGAGVGNVFLAERMDPRIYGSRQFARTMGTEPLVVIPHIANESEERRGRRKRMIWISAICLTLIVAVVVVHLFFRPLDLLYFQFLNRFGIG